MVKSHAERPWSDASAPIWEIVSGYPSRYWPYKQLVALQAYVDDSASEIGDKRLFLAGYVNSATEWIAFSNAWDAVLRAKPSIGYLRMVEAQNLRGEFAGWSKPDRDAKLLSLAGVIEQFRFWFVAISVSRRDYGEIVTPAAPYPLKSPYSGCFWGIIHMLAQYHDSLGLEDIPPVDFIFDEQGGLGNSAALFFEWLKEDQSPKIKSLIGSTPIFRDDKKVVALQAADMLAWHLRRDHERNGAALPLKDKLLHQGAMKDINTDALKVMADRLREVPNVDMIQRKGEWQRLKLTIAALVDAGAPSPRTIYSEMRVRRLILRVGPAWEKVRRFVRRYLPR